MPVTDADKNRSNLLRRYTGASARSYEEKRRGTRRFKSEDAAFEELYALVKPARVLDFPVGTGRWLDFYQRKGAKVTGIDLSQDMLDVAAAKLSSTDGSVRLRHGDMLDSTSFSGIQGEFDLIVSVRFLNWLSETDMKLALTHLCSLQPRHMILGAHVRGEYQRRPGSWLSIKRMRRAVRRLFGQRARHFVHDEALILSLLDRAGFTLREKRLIERKAGPPNFFYLFERRMPADRHSGAGKGGAP